MSNFFLLNEAIDVTDFSLFKEGMSELISIEKEEEDLFLKHDSIYSLEILEEMYVNIGGFTEQAIFKFIEQLYKSEEYIPTEDIFSNIYPEECNAFMGIEFTPTPISENFAINNDASYKRFNEVHLWKLTFKNLWPKRNKLFPHLILCGQVEDQIYKIGQSAHFNQIIARLKEFNIAIQDWETGTFNYREINRRFSLRISPESDQTMAKFGNERRQRLPNGGTEYFNLHIKTGDLRFHFFPDEKNRKVYIGYIGPHLNTISN